MFRWAAWCGFSTRRQIVSTNCTHRQCLLSDLAGALPTSHRNSTSPLSGERPVGRNAEQCHQMHVL